MSEIDRKLDAELKEHFNVSCPPPDPERMLKVESELWTRLESSRKGKLVFLRWVAVAAGLILATLLLPRWLSDAPPVPAEENLAIHEEGDVAEALYAALYDESLPDSEQLDTRSAKELSHEEWRRELATDWSFEDMPMDWTWTM